ncbi:MAG: dienelactone hydrolase family protein [Acidimicrobiia bacterium]
MPALEEGSPVTVEGSLTIPATDHPVPAVILIHGCGGIGSSERGWVDDLTEWGHASLVLDSFGGRGISQVCTGRETMNVASMLVDLYRATETIAANPYIDGSRIAVMGFSFGGRTALWSAMTRLQDLYDAPDLAAHVAFYPSTCFIRLEGEELVLGAPIRIFHGTEDDWTPIDQCEDYVDRLRTIDVDVSLFSYAGAHHSFDNETMPPTGTGHIDVPSPRNCEFVEIEGEIIDSDSGDVAGVGSSCVEIGVQFGYDPDAHQAAKSDLSSLLSGVFDG